MVYVEVDLQFRDHTGVGGTWIDTTPGSHSAPTPWVQHHSRAEEQVNSSAKHRRPKLQNSSDFSSTRQGKTCSAANHRSTQRIDWV